MVAGRDGDPAVTVSTSGDGAEAEADGRVDAPPGSRTVGEASSTVGA